VSRFGLHGRIEAQPGRGEELAQLLLEAAEGLGSNPDCELYVVARAEDDPDAVWVTEVWASREAHAASLEDEAVKAAIARGRPLIAGFSDRVETLPLGGKGLAQG
jgi:quinol monooxygenase YgiN